MIGKILFINSRHVDYLEDLTFAGLTELLGADNVVSYPVNYHYYFSKYQYPKNIGQCRNPLQYISDRLNLKKRLQHFEFDAVVIGSTKEDVFTFYLGIEQMLPKGIPLIYLDGGDRSEIGGDADREHYAELRDKIFRLRHIDIIFKREYLVDRQYEPHVFPLPFSFRPASYPQNGLNKKYDVVFWAVESDPIRTKALELISNKYDCATNGTVTGQTFKHYRRHGKYFLEELSSAKIGYNFRGIGWDTLRYWEIPGVSTMMISGKPNIAIPDNFIHGEHAVFCKNDLSDLISLTDYYLNHPDERESIAKKGTRHVQQYHTYVKRAQYLLDICNDVLLKKN